MGIHSQGQVVGVVGMRCPDRLGTVAGPGPVGEGGAAVERRSQDHRLGVGQARRIIQVGRGHVVEGHPLRAPHDAARHSPATSGCRPDRTRLGRGLSRRRQADAP